MKLWPELSKNNMLVDNLFIYIVNYTIHHLIDTDHDRYHTEAYKYIKGQPNHINFNKKELVENIEDYWYLRRLMLHIYTTKKLPFGECIYDDLVILLKYLPKSVTEYLFKEYPERFTDNTEKPLYMPEDPKITRVLKKEYYYKIKSLS